MNRHCFVFFLFFFLNGNKNPNLVLKLKLSSVWSSVPSHVLVELHGPSENDPSAPSPGLQTPQREGGGKILKASLLWAQNIWWRWKQTNIWVSWCSQKSLMWVQNIISCTPGSFLCPRENFPFHTKYFLVHLLCTRQSSLQTSKPNSYEAAEQYLYLTSWKHNRKTFSQN